jgi:hypothetical protein
VRRRRAERSAPHRNNPLVGRFVGQSFTGWTLPHETDFSQEWSPVRCRFGRAGRLSDSECADNQGDNQQDGGRDDPGAAVPVPMALLARMKEILSFSLEMDPTPGATSAPTGNLLSTTRAANEVGVILPTFPMILEPEHVVSHL